MQPAERYTPADDEQATDSMNEASHRNSDYAAYQHLTSAFVQQPAVEVEMVARQGLRARMQGVSGRDLILLLGGLFLLAKATHEIHEKLGVEGKKSAMAVKQTVDTEVDRYNQTQTGSGRRLDRPPERRRSRAHRRSQASRCQADGRATPTSRKPILTRI